MAKKQKITISVVASILACALVFGIYWVSTEDARTRNGVIQDIVAEIADYRSGESSLLVFIIYDSLHDDAAFQNFLAEQTKEMYLNKEHELLKEFFCALERDNLYCDLVVNTLNDCIISSENLDSAFDLISKLSYLDYYNSGLNLSRHSGIIAEYINQNGTSPISVTPGEGYYANHEDKSTHNRVGIQGSPLYDATTTTHFGDFQHHVEYGVSLNAYYEETSYSRETYYFRDHYLSFDPTTGECVWSGNYIFCFSSAGDLIGFSNLK